MTSRRSRLSPTDPMGLVGWVFADLLLGLVIVFLATQPGDPDAGVADVATTTPVTTTSTTTTTTTTPVDDTPPGVDSQFRCLRIQTDPGRLDDPPGPELDAYVAQLVSELEVRLAEQALTGRRAGIVLLFGTDANSGVGRRYAELFDQQVVSRLPDTFGGAARRSFWGGGPGEGAPTGSIELNIYPLVGPGQPPLGAPNEC